MGRTRSGLIVPGVADIARPGGLVLPPRVDASFDPLTVPWTYAYWAEGPEFEALGYTNGATINPWPDEVSTADLAQGTAGNRPTLVTAEATFNNKPVVRFDGTNDSMSIDWANISQPNEIVIVAKLRSTSGTDQVLFDNFQTSGRHVIRRDGPTGNWEMFGGNNLTGGAADTNLHMLRAVFATTSSFFYVDEVQNLTGSVGTQIMVGLKLCAQYDNLNFGPFDIAFFGVKNGALTADQRADLHAWSQSYYGSP